MLRILRAATLLFALTPLSSADASPQVTAPPVALPAAETDLIKVFLDCNRCDHAHVRQTVGFVDHVLDRAVADVHVLVTTQQTGGGGLSWVVQFIGLNRLQGQTHTLNFDTPATATDDERRTAFVRVFQLGLASAAAGTKAAPQLRVQWTAPATGAARAAVTRDPWNYWVFTARMNVYLNGEASSRSRSQNFGVSANRTTDNLKASLNANSNTNTNTFKFPEQDDVKSRSESWNVSGRIVKTLGRHWAAGVVGNMSHSSFSNIDRSVSLAPAVEFNLFPYSESSRRSLTIYYANGVLDHRYTELTIYDKIRGRYAMHATGAVLALQQPWGSLETAARYQQFLQYLDRYAASFSGSADIRLFKGFSFNVYGSYDRVKNRVSLRKDDATEQEVLLRLQQLATDYEYYMSFGVNYRFGSILNNIVNTRFNELFF